MKKFKFIGQCAGCGDQHLSIQCYKPTRFTPSVTKSKCDECESVNLLTITLPLNRENNRQVTVQPTKVFPSAKLIQMIQERQEQKMKEQSTTQEDNV